MPSAWRSKEYNRCIIVEAGRSGELRKPVAYSVTEQSFPALASTSSPVHHLDLREMASSPSCKLSYPPPLCGASSGRAGAAAASASPGGASLRSTGRVRFMPDGPIGVDLTAHSGSPYRMSSQCESMMAPLDEDVHACMTGAGSSLTAPSSILRVRCLRGGGGQVPHQQHFQSSTVDDLPLPTAVTSSVVSPQTIVSKYN